MIARASVLGVLLATIAGCTGSATPTSRAEANRVLPPAPPPGEAWTTRTLRTQTGRYEVVLSLDPATPPMGALFAVDAVVTETRTGEPLEYGSVQLDARMPQHGHGMMTRPIDQPGNCPEGDPVAPPGGEPVDQPCPHPDGRYRTEGFKFHMPGSWTITVSVKGPRGADTTSVVYEQAATP